jgi:hypothetical protein
MLGRRRRRSVGTMGRRVPMGDIVDGSDLVTVDRSAAFHMIDTYIVRRLS